MMSNSRFMNSNAMSSPPTDADFAFPPMPQPYLGFDAGMSPMPSLERPLLQQQHNNNLIYDSNLDFPNSSFSFQDPSSSSLLPPTTMPLAPPMPSMAIMGMAMPSSLQMPPLMTLPGVPTAELYHPFGGGPSSSFLMREDVGPAGGGRIGLNLGRRTYFSPVDVLAVDRLLNRSRLGGGGMGLGLGMAGVLGLGLGAAHHHQQPPRCQAEGCKADLSAAKHYHRRHKVCEYHAKAAAVAAGGKQQRFCQQCSRFHVLADFDDSKRSCRKRLTEHNRRRRKPASSQGKDSSPPPPPKKADMTSITTSYNSDHKTGASTAAAKSTAISPNGSGVSCLLDMDNGQTSSAAPTALSLAALPLPEKDGGLDTMLMQQVHGHGEDDNDEEQHFMTSLVLQAQQQQQHRHNGSSSHVIDGGNILSCSSVSDHQQNGGCNGFFEVDFI